MASSKRQQELKLKMARLVKQFEAGEITQSDYERYRKQLIDQGGSEVETAAERIEAAAAGEETSKLAMTHNEQVQSHLREISVQAQTQSESLESIRFWVVFMGVTLLVSLIVAMLAALGVVF